MSMPRKKPAPSGQPKPRDANAEAKVQSSILEWIKLAAPDVLAFHVPNGGLRSKPEAARLRWQGVLAGAPDLVFVAPGGRTFFGEVKTATGRLSAEQRAVHDAFVALGRPVAILRGIDDARAAFREWGIRTREAGR
jgi:hypothetical protein